MDEIIENLYLGDMRDAMTAPVDMWILCVLEQRPAEEPDHAIWLPILAVVKGKTVAMHCQLQAAAYLIGDILNRGGRLLVHCGAGIERSPLTVAWFLTFRKGISLEEAYELIKKKRSIVEDRREWLA